MSEVFAKGGVAVITGGASGIGKAAGRRCAEAGMRIVLVDVDENKLVKTRDELAEIVGFTGCFCNSSIYLRSRA